MNPQSTPQPAPPKRRWATTHYVLVVILLLATFLRFFKADSFSFWFDEILTAIDIQYHYKNFFIDRTKVAQFPLWSWDHPPLFFATTKYVTDWLGTSELSFRLFSLITGTLTVAAVYLLGRALFNTRVGLLAAFILAVSAFHVRYSQEARPYAILILSNTLSYWLLVLGLRTPKLAPGVWLGWTLANIVAFYSHYLALIAWASQMVVADIARSTRKQLFMLVGGSLLIGVAYLPWRNNLFQFFERPLDGGVATRSQLAERIYGLVVNELGFGQALVLWASVALIAVAFLLERRRPIQGSILLVLLGAGAQIAVFFIDPSNRHMGARYLLPIYPLWIVLLANATVTCVDWIASTLWQTNGRSLATLMTEISRPRLALGGLAMLVPIGFMTIYLGYAGNDLRLYYQTPREQFKETA